MRIKRVYITAVILTTILLAACDSATWVIADLPPATPVEIPPFVITKPVVEISERINHFTHAGIAFKFLNQAEEAVDSITVSFMLFDARTQSSPFIGSNKFEIRKWDFISPGENKEILISLDQHIYTAPTEPYLIDFFYISEIHFIDNSLWRDEFGKYRVRF